MNHTDRPISQQPSKESPKTHLVAIAGFLASGIAAVGATGCEHLIATDWFGLKDLIWGVGDLIPGSRGEVADFGYLGAYSGSVMIYLITFFGAWVYLASPKTNPVSIDWLFPSVLILHALASILAWTPIFPWLPLE